MHKKFYLLVALLIAFRIASYGQSPAIAYADKSFTVNSENTLSPAITGSAGNFSITPNLPPGLVLNENSGTISGIPVTASPTATYTVHCKAGQAVLTATFALTIANPSDVKAYNPAVAGIYVDSTIMAPLRPADTDPNNTYSIAPALPDGLRLNPQTGEISGAAFSPSKPYTYTVTGLNILTNKRTTYLVNIGVMPRPDVVMASSTISFVGQGDIQQSLNSGAKIAANTGIGVIFRQNSNKHFGVLHDIEVELSINVASTVDTIKSVNGLNNTVMNKQDFGNSVLLPLNSGQAFSFKFRGYLTRKGGEFGNYRRNDAPRPLGGVLSGFDVALSGSNRNWEYDDSIKTVAPIQVKASLLSLYIGPFYEFYMPQSKNGFNRNVSITLGMGYTGRWILGDIQQGNRDDLRSKLLGTTKNSFNGTEIMLALRFYNIKAEVHLPFFSNKTQVPGLSGSHLTTFIGFSGGFPIDLSKPNSGS